MSNYFMQQLKTSILGIFLMFAYLGNVHATQIMVVIEETIKTMETHTTEGEGIGMSGVPVIQPHSSVLQSTITKSFPPSELGTELPLDGTKAVMIIAVGKDRSTGQEAGGMVRKMNEIKKVFTLKSPRQDVDLFLDSAEIVEVEGGYQLKLQLGFRNITNYQLRLTEKTINTGKLVLADNSGHSLEAIQIGPAGSKICTVIYQLPKVNGGYTLQLPTDTSFNFYVPKE